MSGFVEESRAVDVIYLNFSKALDCLPKHHLDELIRYRLKVGWERAEAAASGGWDQQLRSSWTKGVSQGWVLGLCQCRIENVKCVLPLDGIWQLCPYTRVGQGHRNWVHAQGTAKLAQDLIAQIISSKGCWGSQGDPCSRKSQADCKPREENKWMPASCGCWWQRQGAGELTFDSGSCSCLAQNLPSCCRRKAGNNCWCQKGFGEKQSQTAFPSEFIYSQIRWDTNQGAQQTVGTRTEGFAAEEAVWDRGCLWGQVQHHKPAWCSAWNQGDHSLFSEQLKVESQPPCLSSWLEYQWSEGPATFSSMFW